MSIASPLLVPVAQDRITLFFERMEQHEQEIHEAALAVEYSNVFDQLVTIEQCTLAIQALGSLAETIDQFQQSFIGLSVPILVVEMREAVQGPWRLVLEMIDETIVSLASLRAVLPVVEARDVQLRIDACDQLKELLESVAEGFRNGARWCDRVHFESVRFVRLRESVRYRHGIRRRQWN